MKITYPLLAAVALSAGLFSASGAAQATLLPALGSQVINDTDLNITWLANANLAATETFGVNGISAYGTMDWDTAQSWIVAMNTANYLGYHDWHLPTTEPISGTTFNYNLSYNGSTDDGFNVSEQGTAYAGATSSEMAYLYYNSLNDKGYCNPATSTASSCGLQAGYGLVDKGPFTNFQSNPYWSEEYAPGTDSAWYFNFLDGLQHNGSKTDSMYVLAVRDGVITAVPEPAALWLMVVGLLSLIGVTRRKAV